MDIEKYNQRSLSLMTEQEINALDDIELQKVAQQSKIQTQCLHDHHVSGNYYQFMSFYLFLNSAPIGGFG